MKEEKKRRRRLHGSVQVATPPAGREMKNKIAYVLTHAVPQLATR